VAQTILILDNQDSVGKLLVASLRRSERKVLCEPLPAKLADRINDANPDLLILDPGGLALEPAALMAELRAGWPQLPVIIISSAPDVRQAVAAIRQGAFDFLAKPLPLAHLMETVDRALAAGAEEHELVERRRRFKTGGSRDFYKSQSESMSKVYDDALLVAMSPDTTALIQGESGTGKEIIAQLIHQLSPRHLKPFMELNCAAIPSELLESELFGHEAGAFTDAKESKVGLFELADQGTIFLDEIGEMSFNLQVKLLRFLERKTFRRVGGTKDLVVDVRIISATNRDLREMVKAGLFREDLFYRLNVVPIKIPPLRERREDILPLVRYFLKDFNPRFNKNFALVDDEARRLLMEYPWPGNIRELRNVIERIVLMEGGSELSDEHLRPYLGGSWDRSPETWPRRLARWLEEPIPEEGLDMEAIVRELEKNLIDKAYRQADRNQSRAAAMLKLGRDKMRYKMKQYQPEKEFSS